MPKFKVEVEKEDLIFSAAHFITFADNICETLHGHNYRVRCVVEGELNEHGYVTDFVALQISLKQIVKTLDHKTLLPLSHPTISVSESESEVTATFEDRRWILPAGDCMLLPIDNTTAERLAEYIGRQLLATTDFERHNLKSLVVSVDENEGQWGSCEFEL